MPIAQSFFFSCYGAHRDLHSFPTRRSSDLQPAEQGWAQLRRVGRDAPRPVLRGRRGRQRVRDRKSTRLNSSHMSISYAVFCLKKKKELVISVGDWPPLPAAQCNVPHTLLQT